MNKKTATWKGMKFTLSKDDANFAYHRGDCTKDCETLIKKKYVRKQLDSLTKEQMMAWMDDWGVFYDEGDMECIEVCFVWMIAGEFSDNFIE